MESGDAFNPYFFHLALGTQSNANVAMAQGAHDQVACYGRDPGIGAGAIGHVVFTGLTNPQRFVAVDVWNASANIEAFYTNPMFVAAFGQLFSTIRQPTYVSTSGAATATGRTGWYQW